MKRASLFQSLGHAVAVLLYVSGVAWLMSNAETWIGEPEGLLGPIAMLLLFVMSAAITGALVLGKPILLYWNGKKSEALRFFVYTLGWLFVAALILFFFLAR